eukprot:COSAG05_NODE_3067_length_2363_cov_1.393551_1_plen_105_part_00
MRLVTYTLASHHLPNGLTCALLSTSCPFSNPSVTKIATAHKVSTAQVCLRWIIERGCTIAVGTGSDVSKVKDYTKENLDLWSFSLTAADMATLNAIAKPDHAVV